MIQVDCGMLTECCDEWRAIRDRLAEDICILSGLENDALGAIQDEQRSQAFRTCLEEGKQQLRLCASLTFALDTICSLYSESERRVLASGEGIYAAPPLAEVAMVDLSGTADLLQEFAFFVRWGG